jgi:hypothetical protein
VIYLRSEKCESDSKETMADFTEIEVGSEPERSGGTRIKIRALNKRVCFIDPVEEDDVVSVNLDIPKTSPSPVAMFDISN